MIESLDDLYLSWLYDQVNERSVKVRRPVKSYRRLFEQLYDIEFVYLVDKDDNRAEDGRALRYEWDDEIDIFVPIPWLERGCSFLEMLIALSRRLAFEGDGHTEVWFWHLLDNIELTGCTDQSDYDPEYVDERVDTVILRTYDRSGRGGLFPLRNVHKDQRKAELWYQMNAYLLTT